MKKKPTYDPPLITNTSSPTYNSNPRRNSAQINYNDAPDYY